MERVSDDVPVIVAVKEIDTRFSVVPRDCDGSESAHGDPVHYMAREPGGLRPGKASELKNASAVQEIGWLRHRLDHCGLLGYSPDPSL